MKEESSVVEGIVSLVHLLSLHTYESLYFCAAVTYLHLSMEKYFVGAGLHSENAD